jgi:hypothetical protein
MKPIVVPRYKSLLILKNSNIRALYDLEPYYHSVSCSFDYSSYIKQESANSSFDLSKKFIDSPDLNEFNLIAEVDGLSLSPSSIGELQNINYIIHTNNFIGTARIGDQTVTVKSHESLERELISKTLHDKVASMWSGG